MKTATIYLRGVMTDRSPEDKPVDPWLRLERIEVVELDLEESMIEQLRDGSICIRTGRPDDIGVFRHRAQLGKSDYLSERTIPAWRLIEYTTHEIPS